MSRYATDLTRQISPASDQGADGGIVTGRKEEPAEP